MSALPIAEGLALGGWAFSISAMALGTWAALKRVSTPPAHLDAPFRLYPVSILKPVKGIDPGLEENLESFFRLDYPDYELLLSVASPRDPAHDLIQGLLARYPDANARLFVGEANLGPNPKVNNLAKSYRAARHDWILISDSNIRVTPDYLKRQVAHLEPGIGMVTAVVVGRGAEGLGGQLESTFLNTFYTRWMCLAERFGRPCVLGKSMLFRRSDAERFGGVENLGRYLAEDYMAGEAMRRLGRRVIIASDTVTQEVGRKSLQEFWSRHVRWGRIRKAQSVIPFAFEPLTGAIAPCLLGAFAFSGLFGVSASTFVLFHLLTWSIGDALLMRKVGHDIGVLSPLYWLLRELMAIPLWIHVLSGNRIEWRGSKFKLLPGGLIEVKT